MSRIKSDAKIPKRSPLNTTIDTDTLQEFKTKAKMLGINMNVILECMMKSFISNEIVLKVGKNSKIEVDIED